MRFVSCQYCAVSSKTAIRYVCIVWIGGLSPRLRGTRPLTGKCNGRPSLNDTLRSEFKDRLSGTIS